MRQAVSKAKSIYRCGECGAESPKWAGQCPDCGEWNTLVEGVAAPSAAKSRSARLGGYAGAAVGSQVKTLAEVAPDREVRLGSGLAELDRVLGGGLVLGSVVLIGGDPGVGNSTLLLQTLAALSAQLPSLYVTGEDSLDQVSLRATRMHVAGAALRLLAETQVEQIIAHAARERPQWMVIDSILSVYT